jgi:amino acid adenylation domain-containing protein
MDVQRLEEFLRRGAIDHPLRVAVTEPARGTVTYAQLHDLSQSLAASLQRVGVGRNDRVGLCLPKTIASVAAIFATLSSKACYVPVDPGAPASRSAFIFADCTVKAVLVHASLEQALTQCLALEHTRVASRTELTPAECAGAEVVLLAFSPGDDGPGPAIEEDLAYILYTSGSTGKPKGVMHSHSTALSFIDWCSDEFKPAAEDVFSSHAPFHFDLSILDLYVPLKHGASVVLIGESEGKQPLLLASLIEEHRISIWYSTPSILRLLAEYGNLIERDYSPLRMVFYAGEVFPLKYLRNLVELLPGPRYYNLYGPTETNVCTFRRLPSPLPDDDTLPQQIGTVCSGDIARIVDESGRDVSAGEEGELWIAGGSVHLGYWNLPDRNAQAFATDAAGRRWYKTGDLVIDRGGGDLLFIGRRDRMVKRRGFRVELGEIESVLYTHANITEAAVIAKPDAENGVQLLAFIRWQGDGKPSLLQLKRFSSENLLSYMAPDRFITLDQLPKTSTDKIDYQRLKEMG